MRYESKTSIRDGTKKLKILMIQTRELFRFSKKVSVTLKCRAKITVIKPLSHVYECFSGKLTMSVDF